MKFNQIFGLRIAVLALIGVGAIVWLRASGGDGPDPGANAVEGTIMTLGDASITLQTAPDHDAVTLQVPKETPITKDGTRVSLERLGGGDFVTAATKQRDGELVATTIVARSPY